MGAVGKRYLFTVIRTSIVYNIAAVLYVLVIYSINNNNNNDLYTSEGQFGCLANSDVFSCSLLFSSVVVYHVFTKPIIFIQTGHSDYRVLPEQNVAETRNGKLA